MDTIALKIKIAMAMAMAMGGGEKPAPLPPKPECRCAIGDYPLNCRCPGSKDGPCECGLQRRRTPCGGCVCGCEDGKATACKCGELARPAVFVDPRTGTLRHGPCETQGR